MLSAVRYFMLVVCKGADRESVATHLFRLIERGISRVHQTTGSAKMPPDPDRTSQSRLRW